ncbi:MAG TPA: hypothetical protein VG347_04235 [Verrucomicrobiae bacterium]|nr:hypothetical protein [Verrucomicrobiae bacterium]
MGKAGTVGTKPAAAAAPLPAVARAANSPVTGGNPGTTGPAPATGGVVPSPAKPVSAFGGHTGGGKKREDGLIAGSEAAAKVDRENNALRMFINRQAEKPSPDFQTEFNARLQNILPVHRQKFIERAKEVLSRAPSQPSPLPSAAATAGNAPVAVPVGQSPVLGAVVDIGGSPAPVLAPTFIAWTEKMIARPVKLFTKILDRFRVGKLMERVRKLGFSKDVEKEAEQKLAFKQAAVDDFNAALTNCAVIELNKRRVPGAEHSHWLELGMTGGELLNCHMDMVDWLEEKIAEKAVAENNPVKK